MRADLERFAQTPFGRAFIVNFAYCEQRNLFPEQVNRKRLLDKVLQASDAVGAPEKHRLKKISAILGEHFHDALTAADYPLAESHERFYRVVPLSSFLDGDKPLLLNEARLRFGHLRIGPWSEAELDSFAQCAARPENLNPLAEIRGRYPFAWVTNLSPSALSDRGASRRQRCRDIVQRLGLEFSSREPLFVIIYPARPRPVRRPTAVDGFAGRFFKVRTTRDSDSAASPSGFTLDIGKIGVGLDPETNSYDGAPEYVTPPLAFSNEFSVHWIGDYDNSWSNVGGVEVDEIIFASRDLNRAVENCIYYILNMYYS